MGNSCYCFTIVVFSTVALLKQCHTFKRSCSFRDSLWQKGKKWYCEVTTLLKFFKIQYSEMSALYLHLVTESHFRNILGNIFISELVINWKHLLRRSSKMRNRNVSIYCNLLEFCMPDWLLNAASILNSMYSRKLYLLKINQLWWLWKRALQYFQTCFA